MQYVYWLGIGTLVGWFAGRRINGFGRRAWFNILMGMVGATMAGFTMHSLGYSSSDGAIYTDTVVVLSAAAFSLFASAIAGRGRYVGAP